MAYCRACGGEHPAELTWCSRAEASTREGPCGTTLERYAIESYLGGGGMGAVYRARRAEGMVVAIKLLNPALPDRDDALERFVREANASRDIRSPHVVEVYECNIASDGTAYLVMELLRGRSLYTALRDDGALAPTRAVQLAAEVLEGLRHAHARGVVHRDMKPANVFLRRGDDGGESAVVLDFGTSKLLFEQRSSPLTPAGMTLGTPYYMAPEQVFLPSSVDHRTDLYGTAVMLYEMLSGALPFEGTTIPEVLMKACSGAPVPLLTRVPSLSEELIAVVARGMARQPEARFQSAEEFIEALRGLTVRDDPRSVRPVAPADADEPQTLRIDTAALE